MILWLEIRSSDYLKYCYAPWSNINDIISNKYLFCFAKKTINQQCKHFPYTASTHYYGKAEHYHCWPFLHKTLKDMGFVAQNCLYSQFLLFSSILNHDQKSDYWMAFLLSEKKQDMNR